MRERETEEYKYKSILFVQTGRDAAEHVGAPHPSRGRRDEEHSQTQVPMLTLAF